MPPRRTVAPRLPLQELKTRYRSTNQPTLRSHDHMAWLLAEGRTVSTSAEHLGSARPWVVWVMHRYSARGPDAHGDQRHHSSGHPGILNAADRADQTAALAGPAPAGDRWSSPVVSRWLEDRLEQKLHVQRAYERAAPIGHPIRRV